jgi:hypothetical protein
MSFHRMFIFLFALVFFHGLMFTHTDEVITAEESTAKKKITEEVIRESVSNVAEHKRDMIKEMTAAFKQMPKNQQKATIAMIKNQIKNNNQTVDPQDAINQFATAFLAWYLEYSQKPGQENTFFANDTEREKFAKAIFLGELIGMSFEESGINIVNIDKNTVLSFPGDLGRAAMFILEQVEQDLKNQTEKMEQKGENQEEVNREFIESLFEKYATEFKEELLYNMLLLHLYAKMTKSWYPDILAALK